MSQRLAFEDWSSYADFAALLASIGSGTWASADLDGCSFDGTVTYRGHKTLKYDPSVAGAAGFLQYARPTGTCKRLWVRVAFKVDDLYATTQPAFGAGPLPIGCQGLTAAWGCLLAAHPHPLQIHRHLQRPGRRVLLRSLRYACGGSVRKALTAYYADCSPCKSATAASARLWSEGNQWGGGASS